jgi:hypothetical protein
MMSLENQTMDSQTITDGKRLRLSAGQTFNRAWTFVQGDPSGAEHPDYKDAAWEPVGLPHSFSIPYFLSDQFYVGYGWYRKHFDIEEGLAGKRFYLEFDGVFQVAEVFVNGQRIGEHRGGYTGFTFDVTDAVKIGDNVVAVRVNNLWDAQLAPRAGEHVFSGGIYRNVRLVVTDPLHVAWYGTFVTTPQVSRESATVNVKTEVTNSAAIKKSATLVTRILDSEGKLVMEMTSTRHIPAGATETFDQTSDTIAEPMLWSPEDPYLYSVHSIVLDDGNPVDDYLSPLGIRWFEWTADRGFFLNGEHYYFRGVNAHQDHAGWGDAVADSGFYRDVRMIKEAGFNFVRGSHYPHAPAFSDACDEQGLLFWSENCYWAAGRKADGYWDASSYPPKPEDQEPFEQSVRDSLHEMIRIHRNHPSIVAWSMCNEVFFAIEDLLPKVRNLLKELVAYSHELDPTRPAAIGGCQRGELDKLGDIAGYNGDGAVLFLDPGIPNVVSEYGSTISDRPGEYEPGFGQLQKEPGKEKDALYEWRSGEVLWCGFDHGSRKGEFGCMGMVDYFRLPKRMWYWYRNAYRNIPPPVWPKRGKPAGLRLTADTTTLDAVDGTRDAQITVAIVDEHGNQLSNCQEVTLEVVSGPGEFPTGRSITFSPESDIAIRDGLAAMEFRSYHAGKSVIRATSSGLPETTIEITSLGEPEFIAGVTPVAPPRPYVRFTTQTGSEGVEEFGLDCPTLASSQAVGHNSSMANDGNPDTDWQADGDDDGPWWQVDLERLVLVTEAQLTFPVTGEWCYSVDVSGDGRHWTTVCDEGQASQKNRVCRDVLDRKVVGRFLRVVFTGSPNGESATLIDVNVWGVAQSGGVVV